MAQVRLIREQTVAETRYAAIGEDGRAVSLFVARDWAPARLLAGSVHEGRLRSVVRAQGGAFVEVAGHPDAFLRLKPDVGLTEGARVRVRTIAEAHDDKLARVALAADGEPATEPVESWRSGLPGFGEASVLDLIAGDPEIAGIFDEALSPSVTLPMGGRMTIERTRALTAADIDSAGWSGKGSPGASAKAINTAAAVELARQLELRQLGGLVVLDCIAPLTRASGNAVREAFLAAHAGVSRRRAKALAPSSLGLMELSLEWGRMPLAAHYLDAAGRPTPQAIAIAGLGELEREASRDRMARLTLRLPGPAHHWIASGVIDFQSRLVARYGARLSLAAGQKLQPEVHPSP